MTQYPGRQADNWKTGDPQPDTSQRTVPDAPEAFAAVRFTGDYLAAHDGGMLPGKKFTKKNHGENRARNHFQGVQRFERDGTTYLLITGGDVVIHRSILFLIEMGSRGGKDAYGTNMLHSKKPPDKDRLVSLTKLSAKHWHSGGMDLLGNVLAIPVEDDRDNTSEVWFLDLADPTKPKKLPAIIVRDAKAGKAGAVALTRLPNRHFLCAVWSDSDEFPVRIDFYLSTSQKVTDGFGDKVSWPYSSLTPTGGGAAKYQTINFLNDDKGDLYLVGFENLSAGAPILEKDDVADLLKIELTDKTLASSPTLGVPAIRHLCEKRFRRSKPYANFDASAGAYVSHDNKLFLYAGYHWRRDERLNFVEYTPGVLGNAPPIDAGDEGWIELFDEVGFQGRRLTVRTSDAKTEIENYKDINVQGESFGDDVASVRYQLPTGQTYCLFKDSGLKPTDREVVELVGTGAVVEIPDIDAAYNFDVGVSSSRFKT